FIIRTIFLLCFTTGASLQAQEEIERTFRDALYQEEVKGDVEGALKAYQEVGEHLAKQRDLAAMVMFRQAECLLKLNRLEEAAARYELVLKLYPDHERVVRMSEENLAAL